MMFASGYPASGSYWLAGLDAGSPTVAAAAAVVAASPSSTMLRPPSLYSDPLNKRPSFYISDILYPSVIPLAGTLPNSPSVGSGGVVGSSGSSSSSQKKEGYSPGTRSLTPSSTPKDLTVSRSSAVLLPPPPVKSQDLKFGIDRILNGSTKDVKREGKKAT